MIRSRTTTYLKTGLMPEKRGKVTLYSPKYRGKITRSTVEASGDSYGYTNSINQSHCYPDNGTSLRSHFQVCRKKMIIQ